jgi:hypothetical protein
MASAAPALAQASGASRRSASPSARRIITLASTVAPVFTSN